MNVSNDVDRIAGFSDRAGYIGENGGRPIRVSKKDKVSLKQAANLVGTVVTSIQRVAKSKEAAEHLERLARAESKILEITERAKCKVRDLSFNQTKGINRVTAFMRRLALCFCFVFTENQIAKRYQVFYLEEKLKAATNSINQVKQRQSL